MILQQDLMRKGRAPLHHQINTHRIWHRAAQQQWMPRRDPVLPRPGEEHKDIILRQGAMRTAGPDTCDGFSPAAGTRVHNGSRKP